MTCKELSSFLEITEEEEEEEEEEECISACCKQRLLSLQAFQHFSTGSAVHTAPGKTMINVFF